MNPNHYPDELAPHLSERFAYYSSARRASVVLGTILSGLFAAVILTHGESVIANAGVAATNLLLSLWMVVAARSLTAINQRLIETVERVRCERRTRVA